MALKATIFKAELQIANMDRNYYTAHNLTIARHPSETDERMMLRLLAFALSADEQLGFTRGISNDDEPDLWQQSLSGEIEHWIELGQPDEKRIRKACGRAHRVTLHPYSGSSADIWWSQNSDRLQRFENLDVIAFPTEAGGALAPMARRNMQLQCNIQDGEAWFSDGENDVTIRPQIWKTA
ncbi:MAG: YaeQ family protein [Gammaproteobacteria bacterium]|nr:YaeQ family protein [Gammaproteobacteria bacterium]MCF6364492.1 YaeQ family protein [Gammaproteobacteria bacterium]